jgi:hypothetical protein
MRKLLTALVLTVALVAPQTAGAAVRHALQSELYGLTQAQRNSGATLINQALDGENVDEVFNRLVDPAKVLRGQTMLFVEVDFSSDAAGQRIFNAARNWADGRATDVINNRGTTVHSYVRVRSVDDVARTITQRYAESPGWVAAVTVESLDT